MRRLCLSLVPLLLLAVTTAVSAADLRLARTADVDLPACDTVLERVSATFAHGAREVEKRPDLTLAAFGTVHEAGAGTIDRSPTVSRWCSAPVTLSDGTHTTAYWRLDRSLGFASAGYAEIPDGIEVCVAGHDPWHVHDGLCRTVRRWW